MPYENSSFFWNRFTKFNEMFYQNPSDIKTKLALIHCTREHTIESKIHFTTKILKRSFALHLQVHRLNGQPHYCYYYLQRWR